MGVDRVRFHLGSVSLKAIAPNLYQIALAGDRNLRKRNKTLSI
ncbi:hypothetical protein CKA32_002837 [Geitlerinema sp. FC II]|nr:hypothetical protein CKA32_002837 [Geitlerinema sp. FC II]